MPNILMLENKALQAVNAYLLTRHTNISVDIKAFPYYSVNEHTYQCPDMINACKGIYGFYAEQSYSYISTFSDNMLLRFKFKNIDLIRSELDHPLPQSFPSCGPLIGLLDTSDLCTTPKNDTFNCYPIYTQFLDLFDSIDNMSNISEPDLVTSYMLISKQKYGVQTKLKLTRNIEQITDLRELVALFRGLYIVNDCMYARVLSKDTKTVFIMELRWEN